MTKRFEDYGRVIHPLVGVRYLLKNGLNEARCCGSKWSHPGMVERHESGAMRFDNVFLDI